MQSRLIAPVEQFESSTNIVLRTIAGLAGFAALIVCLVNPERLAWASLPLWPGLRWAGAPLGMASVLMLVWVHHELGRNFSGTLHLRAEHTLITSGPYRWVRHPMYTAMYGVALTFFLLSANWFIGAIFLGGLTSVMISRVGKEETVMATKFGGEYQAWTARTDRFLPRLRN